jgi:antitoxin component YwqK of YwqJK toxin-antitoxin module
MKIHSILLLVAFVSCGDKKGFDYENAAYRRISSDADSLKYLYVKYVAEEDSNWAMTKHYYPNGQLFAYIHTYKGKEHGTSKAFYENGLVKFIVQYKQGEFDTGWYYSTAGKLWYLRIRDTATGYIRDSSIFKEPWE